MQRLEVSCAVRDIYIYVSRLRVNCLCCVKGEGGSYSAQQAAQNQVVKFYSHGTQQQEHYLQIKTDNTRKDSSHNLYSVHPIVTICKAH